MAVGLNFSVTTVNDFINHPSGLIIDLARHNGLTLLLDPLSAHALLAFALTSSRDLPHRRCGHLHESGLLKLDSLGIHGVSGLSKLSPLSFALIVPLPNRMWPISTDALRATATLLILSTLWPWISGVPPLLLTFLATTIF